MSKPTQKSGASRWFRANLWVHRWASLVATLPFLVLCISGTVLIFHEEIDHALGVVPSAQSTGGDAQSMARAIAAVQAAYPDERVLSTGIDPDDHPGVQLVVTGPKANKDFIGAQLRFVDLATAQLIGEADPQKTLTGFLLELHAQWFLGPAGELLGALIALFVLLSLLSGLVVYAPYVKRIAFGVLRRGKDARLLQLDLHNFIGMVVLGWALVVTITGFLLGFSTIAIGVWQATELHDLQRMADAAEPVDVLNPPVDLDRVFAAAHSTAEAGWHVETVIFPGTTFSTPRHYTALLVGDDGIEQRLFRVAAIDAATGEVAAAVQPPAYLKAIVLSQPLHFGDYGGLLLKLLWTLCTWLTLFITANGAWLWWDRRRRRSPKAAGAPA
jgi:uncharacterized iron-regulated membrane protein